MSIETMQKQIIEIESELCDIRKGDVYKSIMEMVEKPIIEYALGRTGGNQLMAARILGINRNTIRSKTKKFGIDARKWKMA